MSNGGKAQGRTELNRPEIFVGGPLQINFQVHVLSLTTQFCAWLAAHSFTWDLSPDCCMIEGTLWETHIAAALWPFPAAWKAVQQPLKKIIILSQQLCRSVLGKELVRLQG